MPRSVAAPGTAVCVALASLLWAGAGPTAASAASRDGRTWVLPLGGAPQVVRAFEPPPQRWIAGHRGVDLLGREGSAVGAAGAGSVTFAGQLAGRGVVVVSHSDGTRTTYEPVAASVAVGDRVHAGDRLGVLTGGGGHCLPMACLHWGRRRGDVYLDPMLLVRAGPARLLPLWSATRDSTAARDGPPTGSSGSLAPGDVIAGQSQPSAAGRWRLAASGAAGLPVLAIVAAQTVRRRRGQSRVGSAAASSA